MNKELQDLAWSVLPKEFKEEVKYYYQHTDSGSYAEDMLESIFGKHNLTSDAEGEVELLHVTRQKVLGLYANAKKLHNLYTSATCINETESRTIDHTDGTMWVLKNLFGSKCLPDENKECSNPSVVNCKHKHGDGTCSLGNMCCHKSPKPAEPKFKVGDKVVIIANCKHKGEVAEIIHVDKGDPICAYYLHNFSGEWYSEFDLEPYTEPKYHKGEKVYYNGYAYEVEGLVGKNRYALKGLNFDLDEDMIEPYTEPNPIGKEVNFPTKNESRNLSKNIANCDKQFDNILKDSFSKERKLNIATRMASAYISSEGMTDPSLIATIAFQLADALIAECEEGGSHD